MSNALDFCENAVVVRHAEVAKIMQQVEVKRIKLFSRIQNEEVDEADALCRNRTLPGSLGMVGINFWHCQKRRNFAS